MFKNKIYGHWPKGEVMKFMYKSLIIAIASLIVQSNAFAARPKGTIIDRVNQGNTAGTKSNGVQGNRLEVAEVLKSMRKLGIKTMKSEDIPITNVSILIKVKEFFGSPVVTDFVKNGGRIEEANLPRVFDTLAKIGVKAEKNESTNALNDALEVAQLNLLSLLPEAKLTDLKLDKNSVDRCRVLFEQKVDTAVNPAHLSKEVHSQLVSEEIVPEKDYNKWVDAIKRCLQSLKG